MLAVQTRDSLRSKPIAKLAIQSASHKHAQKHTITHITHPASKHAPVTNNQCRSLSPKPAPLVIIRLRVRNSHAPDVPPQLGTQQHPDALRRVVPHPPQRGAFQPCS